MKHASCLLLAAAGLAAAETTRIVTVLLPQVNRESIVGSVISAGPTATAYSVSCVGEDAENCGLPPGGLEVTYGPRTWEYGATVDDETYTAKCSLNSAKDVADCVGTAISGKSTATMSDQLTGYSEFIVPVTATAGVSKLPEDEGDATITGGTTSTDTETATETETATATATESETASETSASDTTTEAPSTTESPSGTEAPSTSDEATETTSSSTGGVPRITQNAVIMGAAAVVGGALML